MVVTGKDLFNYAKANKLTMALSKKKGVKMFEELSNYIDPNKILFAFVGFHNYKSFWNHDGYAIYGFIEDCLFIFNEKDNEHYLSSEYKNVSVTKKKSNYYLDFVFTESSFTVDVGSQLDIDLIITSIHVWKDGLKKINKPTNINVKVTTHFENPNVERLFKEKREIETEIKRLNRRLNEIDRELSGK